MLASILRNIIENNDSMIDRGRISILIVDDDERLLCALQKVLSNEGFRVTPANWAAEAMEHLEDPQKRFDLIITDLHLPFVRGATFLRMIRPHLNLKAEQALAEADGKRVADGTAALNESADRNVRATAHCVPVIVLTAYGSADIREECLRLGAAAFLEKPLDTQELLAATDAVLAQSKGCRDQEQTVEINKVNNNNTHERT